MFTNHVQHSKNVQMSIFSHKNYPSLMRVDQGYHNIDSPLKAALRLQKSPRQNLSPLRYQNQTDSKLNNRRSRSPIFLSKRGLMSPEITRLSPLIKRQVFQHQQNYGPQKHISFTNFIKRNSNTGNYESQNPSQFNRTMEHSNQNYLHSDRNFCEDTNLFKKLANMIKSNKSNDSSFTKSGISSNSVRLKTLPQSCKNESNSNKKMFIKNVMTVESIQSPEERDCGGWQGDYDHMETRCYQEYERMTEGCGGKERQGSVDWCKEMGQVRMKKKDSKKEVCQGQEVEALSFKKISFGNQEMSNQPEEPQTAKTDYHLTNSFGTSTTTLKNQIIGHPQKSPINPFQQIISPSCQQIQPIQSINRSVNQSKDSMFASLQMLLSKVSSNNHPEVKIEKEHQSINVSIGDNCEDSEELDMEPFLDKRK